MIDKKTNHLKLPLPDAANELQDDCPRLVEAIKGVDAHAATVDGRLGAVEGRAGTLETGVSSLETRAAQHELEIAGLGAAAEGYGQRTDAALGVLTGRATNLEGGVAALETRAQQDEADFAAHLVAENPHGIPLPHFDLATGKVYYPGYPGQFQNFQLYAPPVGWMVRNGAVLAKADVDYPDLWAALHHPTLAGLCKTLAEWTALSTAAGGVGGVPYFVVDDAAKTIKLPDTRGDYTRDAGSSYLQTVGSWHADATLQVSGFAGGVVTHEMPSSSPFYYQENLSGIGSGPYGHSYMHFNNARQVRTASDNRTRAYGMLGCVYVGMPT